MKKWKNPYVTLLLGPEATDEEIRLRSQKLADSSEEAPRIAREAREELTQNVDKLFPAFLTAIPGLYYFAEEIKNLRKRNRKPVKLSDDVQAEAFTQMGLSFDAESPTVEDAEKAVLDEIRQNIGIKTHLDEIDAAEKAAGLKKKSKAGLKSIPKTKIKIPHLFKG